MQVVDPVKLADLSEFGDASFVGDRVVAAERARDGVTEARLLDARALQKDGTTYYQCEPHCRSCPLLRCTQPRRSLFESRLLTSSSAHLLRRLSCRRIEYENASSRGDTRFLSRIAVAGGRLYILTAQARTADYDAARADLERAAETFTVGAGLRG
mmetsp:Transcript_5985/g.25038  ORF Transcript_5985/g.25038 Transcript_5985/m.25038 type:complete len:156 (-) Transcript_5985:106-573(-)